MAKHVRGWRKIDEIEGPNREKIEIRCNLASGVFMAEIPDPNNPRRSSLEKFEGKNLEKVKADAIGWLKGNEKVVWEAIIILRGATKWRGVRDASDSSLDLHYGRFFRAKRPDGDYLWKDFKEKDNGKKDSDDEVEGVPGELNKFAPHTGEDSLVLPYTPERWSALRMISLLIKQLNERINALFDQGGLDNMLTTIADRGARALLLPAPKERE